eukprot:2655406-Pleurochrysis_carterae.AAC.1
MFKFSGLDKAKTFRPRRNHRVGTKRYELHKYAQVCCAKRMLLQSFWSGPALRLVGELAKIEALFLVCPRIGFCNLISVGSCRALGCVGDAWDWKPPRGGDHPSGRGPQRVVGSEYGATARMTQSSA